jgi:hypothetical protein
VLRKDEEVLTFAAWWKTVDKDEVVGGTVSTRASRACWQTNTKQDVMAEFWDFMDNSQPIGRQQGSYSAHFFFLPQFTRIVGPTAREREKNYEKCKSSVVAQFNRAQLDKGPTRGNTAARKWLHKHRPKVALHPSMTDYYDTCKYLKE